MYDDFNVPDEEIKKYLDFIKQKTGYIVSDDDPAYIDYITGLIITRNNSNIYNSFFKKYKTETSRVINIIESANSGIRETFDNFRSFTEEQNAINNDTVTHVMKREFSTYLSKIDEKIKNLVNHSLFIVTIIFAIILIIGIIFVSYSDKSNIIESLESEESVNLNNLLLNETIRGILHFKPESLENVVFLGEEQISNFAHCNLNGFKKIEYDGSYYCVPRDDFNINEIHWRVK